MTLPELARLILLAALWGGSFMLMRVAVPAFGPVWLIALRVSVAAVFLLAMALALRRPVPWRGHVRHHLLLGLFNSALPFLLFAWAAQHLAAATMAVLNATSPLFGVLIGWLAFGQRPTLKTALGLGLGLAGVSAMVGATALGDGHLPAVIAALVAPFCYALASHYTRHANANLPPFANACGSMLASTVLLLPLLPLLPLPPFAAPFAAPASSFSGTFSAMAAALPWPALGAAVALGLLCTGLAYLLYFRLIADVGAVSALSVTYLIPAFGIGWGVLLLGESVAASTWLGLVSILAGVALVTGLADRLLRPVRTGVAP